MLSYNIIAVVMVDFVRLEVVQLSFHRMLNRVVLLCVVKFCRRVIILVIGITVWELSFLKDGSVASEWFCLGCLQSVFCLSQPMMKTKPQCERTRSSHSSETRS